MELISLIANAYQLKIPEDKLKQLKNEARAEKKKTQEFRLDAGDDDRFVDMATSRLRQLCEEQNLDTVDCDRNDLIAKLEMQQIHVIAAYNAQEDDDDKEYEFTENTEMTGGTVDGSNAAGYPVFSGGSSSSSGTVLMTPTTGTKAPMAKKGSKQMKPGAPVDRNYLE